MELKNKPGDKTDKEYLEELGCKDLFQAKVLELLEEIAKK